MKTFQEWRKIFPTMEELLAYNGTIARMEFEEAVKGNPRVWGLGTDLSRKKLQEEE